MKFEKNGVIAYFGIVDGEPQIKMQKGDNSVLIEKGQIKILAKSGNNEINIDTELMKIELVSENSGGAFSGDTTLGSIIKLDANSGDISVRALDGSSVSYISPTGIFTNKAETQMYSAAAGSNFATTAKSAIVGLGNGSVNFHEIFNDRYPEGQYRHYPFVAGIYARASNSGNAPAYAAYFDGDVAIRGSFFHRGKRTISKHLYNENYIFYAGNYDYLSVLNSSYLYPTDANSYIYINNDNVQDGKEIVIFNRNDNRSSLYIKNAILGNTNFQLAGGAIISLKYDSGGKEPYNNINKWIIISYRDNNW